MCNCVSVCARARVCVCVVRVCVWCVCVCVRARACGRACPSDAYVRIRASVCVRACLHARAHEAPPMEAPPQGGVPHVLGVLACLHTSVPVLECVRACMFSCVLARTLDSHTRVSYILI